MRSESCLPFVAFLDPYKVVSAAEIELRETLGFRDLVEGIVDQRKRTPVLSGDCVQGSVIDAESGFS